MERVRRTDRFGLLLTQIGLAHEVRAQSARMADTSARVEPDARPSSAEDPVQGDGLAGAVGAGERDDLPSRARQSDAA